MPDLEIKFQMLKLTRIAEAHNSRRARIMQSNDDGVVLQCCTNYGERDKSYMFGREPIEFCTFLRGSWKITEGNLTTVAGCT